jgi:hypothetical protein
MPRCLNKRTWQSVDSLDITRQADPSAWFVEPDLSRVAGESDRRFWTLPADAFNGPDLMPAAEQLPIRKADKLRAIDRWERRTLGAGFTIDGVALASDATATQEHLARAQAIQVQLAQGVPAATATYLLDARRRRVDTTLGGALATLMALMAAGEAVAAAAAALRAAVDAAADRAALDAVSVPSC